MGQLSTAEAFERMSGFPASQVGPNSILIDAPTAVIQKLLEFRDFTGQPMGITLADNGKISLTLPKGATPFDGLGAPQKEFVCGLQELFPERVQGNSLTSPIQSQEQANAPTRSNPLAELTVGIKQSSSITYSGHAPSGVEVSPSASISTNAGIVTGRG